MADISIDEAKAKIWLDDVNAEIDAVEGILKKVNSSVTTPAGSDDSIMKGIEKIGVAMENAWTAMCNHFKQSQSKLKEAIDMIVRSAQTVIDDADSVKSKVNQ